MNSVLYFQLSVQLKKKVLHDTVTKWKQLFVSGEKMQVALMCFMRLYLLVFFFIILFFFKFSSPFKIPISRRKGLAALLATFKIKQRNHKRGPHLRKLCKWLRREDNGCRQASRLRGNRRLVWDANAHIRSPVHGFALCSDGWFEVSSESSKAGNVTLGNKNGQLASKMLRMLKKSAETGDGLCKK